MKSTYKGEMSVNFSSIVVDEINIIGSRCGPFEPALRLMESRQVDPTVLIADEFKLEDALKHLSAPQKQACSKCWLSIMYIVLTEQLPQAREQCSTRNAGSQRHVMSFRYYEGWSCLNGECTR